MRVRATVKAHRTQVREWMGGHQGLCQSGWEVIKAFVVRTTFLVWQPPSHGFPTAQFHSLTFDSHLWVVDFPTDELCLTTALYTIYV